MDKSHNYRFSLVCVLHLDVLVVQQLNLCTGSVILPRRGRDVCTQYYQNVTYGPLMFLVKH